MSNLTTSLCPCEKGYTTEVYSWWSLTFNAMFQSYLPTCCSSLSNWENWASGEAKLWNTLECIASSAWMLVVKMQFSDVVVAAVLRVRSLLVQMMTSFVLWDTTTYDKGHPESASKMQRELHSSAREVQFSPGFQFILDSWFPVSFLCYCTNGYCNLQRAKERQTLLAQRIASVTKKSKASKGLGNRDIADVELGQSRKYQSILLL